MKKYIYQFMVALFAISSFALVACSDDGDDPTSDTDIISTSANRNLTFNGVNLFNSGSLFTMSGFDEDDPYLDKSLSIMIYRDWIEEYFMITIPVDDISLHKGMDLCDEEALGFEDDHPDEPFSLFSLITFGLSIDDPKSLSLSSSSDFLSGYMMTGGSMVVEEYTGKRIRLRLTNCKFTDYSDYINNNFNIGETVTINGIIDVPLDNEIHKL